MAVSWTLYESLSGILLFLLLTLRGCLVEEEDTTLVIRRPGVARSCHLLVL